MIIMLNKGSWINLLNLKGKKDNIYLSFVTTNKEINLSWQEMTYTFLFKLKRGHKRSWKNDSNKQGQKNKVCFEGKIRGEQKNMNKHTSKIGSFYTASTNFSCLAE